MRNLKPVVAALISAGALALPQVATAIPPTPFDMAAACTGGPPVSVSGNLACSGGVTLTADCNWKIPAGASLTLQGCFVNAQNNDLVIKGGGTSTLTLNNGSMTNAVKVELNLGDGAGNACGQAIASDWYMDSDKIDINAKGGVQVSASGFAVGDLSVKAKNGNVCLTLGSPLQTDSLTVKSDNGTAQITIGN